ncbi:WD40-repeat-containing domain protein [Suillus lakei]|nr:WD40-repeat-containing domain protein [Suillus lakei]
MPPPPTTSNGNAAAPSASYDSALKCVDGLLKTKLKPAKIFKGAVEPTPPSTPVARSHQGPRHITAITFDDRGDQVLTAAEDETFRLYSCKTGKHTTVVHASTKEDDTIRYHSLHDNKYLQYFKGHSGRVVSLEVSPIDDGFMSGSLDKTVRLWDLRAPTCRGLLNLPASPIVAYDSSGLVFAVGVNHYSRILLYDQANYDKDPFLTITLEDPTLALVSYPPRPIYMTSLSFSPNAKYILVGCSGDAHYILDAFEGHLLAKLEGHVGLERRRIDAPQTIDPSKGNSGEEVSWTPDSKYVVSGSSNGKIIIWDVQNLPVRSGVVDLKAHPTRLQPLTTLDGHPGPSRCVRFNPRLAMIVSAGAELRTLQAFWLPDQSADNEEIAKELLRKK